MPEYLFTNSWSPVLLAGLLSLGLVGVYRKLAMRAGMLDRPNERSSHQGNTPRGGGLVILLLYGLGFFAYFDLPADLSPLFFLCPLLLGLVGLLDDFFNLSTKLRLLAYSLIVALALALLGLPQPLSTFAVFPLPLFFVIALLLLLWLINLFNFMDGINGIAGCEALFVLAGIYLMENPGSTAPGFQVLLVIGAICGFLYWNFPAGKVFMGDVGSIFLGALCGLFILRAAYLEGGYFFAYLILLGVFFVDASYTLAVRFFSGQPIMQAHRSHAYQLLSRRWNSHAKVVLAVMLVNLLWLLPLAIWARLNPNVGGIIMLLAFAPLVGICQILGAGRLQGVDK